MDTGLLLATLDHTSDLTSAEFNKRGDKIVTASWDGMAKIWQQKLLSLRQLILLHRAMDFLVTNKEEILSKANELALQKNISFTDALIEILNWVQS